MSEELTALKEEKEKIIATLQIWHNEQLRVAEDKKAGFGVRIGAVEAKFKAETIKAILNLYK